MRRKILIVFILVFVLGLVACNTESKQFTITFDSCGGSSVSEMLVDEGDTINNLPTPIRDNHEFAGWYDNINYTGQDISTPFSLKNSITLYAKWNKVNNVKVYTISFDTNGGNHFNTITINEGDLLQTPDNPIRDNYQFIGWYDNSVFNGNVLTFPFYPTSDIVLYARWQEVYPEYTVSFNLGYTSAGGFSNQTSNGQILMPTTPIREGFEFNGWYTSNNFGITLSVLWDFNTIVTADMTLYADWVEESKVIGQLKAPNLNVDNNEITWSPIPQANGYDIEISFTENGQKVIYSVDYTPNTFYYYNWFDANIYTVRVRARGNGTTTVNSSYATRVLYHRVLVSATGFNFDYNTNTLSWNKVDDATSYDVFIKDAINGSYVKYKTVTEEEYKLEEDYSPGIIYFKIVSIAPGFIESNALYTFNNLKLLPVKDVRIEVIDNVYELTWSSGYAPTNGYEIKINDSSYTTPNNYYYIDIDKLSALESLTIKVRALNIQSDYLASNWSEEIMLTKLEDISLTYNNGYISWEPVENAIGYYIYSDNITAITTSETTCSPIFTDNLTQTVYVQAIGSSGYVHTISSIDVNVFTVKFESDGDIVETKYIAENAIVNEPAITKTGYYIIKWNEENFDDVWYFDSNKVTKDVTLIADWKAIEYNISYNGNGGRTSLGKDVSDNSYHTYDEPHALLANQFNKIGYSFDKWKTTINNVDFYYDDSEVISNLTSVNQNIVFYAQWKPIEYQIKYDANQGQGDSFSITYKYDEYKPLAKNTFSRKGHSFAGWSLTADGELLYGDEEIIVNLSEVDKEEITFYAIWKPLSYNIRLIDDFETSYKVYFSRNISGSTTTVQTITQENSLRYETPSSLSGHIFLGWYDNPSCIGKPYDFTSEITSDVRLYAKWKPYVPFVEGVLRIGQKSTSFIPAFVTSNYGYYAVYSLVDQEVSITAHGNTNAVVRVLDENLNSELHRGHDFKYHFEAGVIYYVQLVPSLIYDLCYISVSGITTPPSGGRIPSQNIEAIYGNVYTSLPDLYKEGYNFVGWYTEKDGKGSKVTNGDDVTITSDIQLYAYFI